MKQTFWQQAQEGPGLIQYSDTDAIGYSCATTSQGNKKQKKKKHKQTNKKPPQKTELGVHQSKSIKLKQNFTYQSPIIAYD